VVPVWLRKGIRGALAEERWAERVHDDERPLNDSPADSAPAISRAVAAARPSRQRIGGPALPHLRGDGSRVDFDAAHASRGSDSSRPCQRSLSRAETAACAAASLTGPDDFAERLARLASSHALCAWNGKGPGKQSTDGDRKLTISAASGARCRPWRLATCSRPRMILQ